MAAEQDVDRSESATPFKLKKAQQRGQVARSADFGGACVFAVAMLFFAWQGGSALAGLLRACRMALVDIGALHGGGWERVSTGLLGQAAAVMLPFLALLMLTAAAAAWLQSGFVLSIEPLKIDFRRLNPATGLRRVISMRTLFDGARACVKLGVLALAAWQALKALLPQFLHVASLPPSAFLQLLIDDASSLGLELALVLVLVAIADLAFTRYDFGRKMRMSRRELKDEFKEREGDPRIRGRLRELRRELLKRSQALRNTRGADVVLTNPTHYAVALRYVHGEMPAPRLVAKGAGQLAAAMREIAYRHRVTVVQNPPLARRLFRQVAIDEFVPADFHAEVAKVIVWVFAMREQRRAGAAA